MFYELEFDMERIDKAIKDGTNTIFAEDSNMEDIEYPGVAKGFFDNYIYNNGGRIIKDWPDVEFYYSSKASKLESEYLLNSSSLPIIHKRVQELFEKEEIQGIQYLPIKLIDIVTEEVNDNYFLMNILNVIEAIDLKKSEYSYDEEFEMYSFLPHTMYLNNDICQNYDIFRATKMIVPIYVSQKIKDMIEKNNWVGFNFYKQQ